jgi:hypothetical protein
MKKALGIIFVVALFATPAMAQKVTIDYAHDFDFKGISTYQYVDTAESNAKNPLMAERVTAMLKKELAEGGLEEVSENPDIFVTYHVTTKDKTSYNTSSYGYGGYWGGWYGWGGPAMGTTTVSEYNYTEGTLIFDAYDAKEKKLIWRGSGTVTVKSKPEKQIKQVDNILKKLGNKWDKILKGMGK